MRPNVVTGGYANQTAPARAMHPDDMPGDSPDGPNLTHLIDSAGGQIDDAIMKVGLMLGRVAGAGEGKSCGAKADPGIPPLLHRAMDNREKLSSLLLLLDQLASVVG